MSFLSRLNLYPDHGMDSEGYDLNTVKVVIAVIGILIMIGTSVFSDNLAPWISVALYCISFACSGIFCLINLFSCLTGGRIFCECLPVVAAGIASLCAGLYVQAILVAVSFEAVKIFLNLTIRRENGYADNVLNILPKYASVLVSRTRIEKRKPVHLRKNDVIVVRENEIIPINGKVVQGMSTVDYSPVTSVQTTLPVNKGSEVVSGGINREKPIIIRASCDYNASAAKRIFSSFSSSAESRSRYGEMAERIYNILFPAMIALSLVFALLVPVLSHDDNYITDSRAKTSYSERASEEAAEDSFEKEIIREKWNHNLRKAAVILLCACPFGLLELLDLFVFTAVRLIFSSGMVIRDGKLLDKLSRLETFVCNKTGTVTEKEYSVVCVIPSGHSSDEAPDPDDPKVIALLNTAAKAESFSKHPIAEAIRRYVGKTVSEETEDAYTDEIPGKGVIARFGEETVYCGNAALLFENGINCVVPNSKGSVIHVAVNGEYLGYILLSNEIREGNFDALERLRACGLKNFSLFSGDLRSVVRPVAASLSFSNVRAELKPEEKVNAVQYLMGTKAKSRTLAFLGNGSDEMECASKADISASSDALFNETAWNSADVVIFSEGIGKFPYSVSAAYSSMRLSFAALIANLSLRALLIILAMTGIMQPVAAVLFLSAVSAVFGVLDNKIE